MHGVVRNFGLGLTLSFCIGAIAACQNATEAPEETTPPDTAPVEAPEAPADSTAAPQPETPTAAAPDSPPAAAPTTRPVPPLPAECSSPQTQSDMNTCAQAEYDQADAELNNAYQIVKSSVSASKADQLITAEEAWITFRDEYCDFVQAEYAGGSIQPTVYYGCLTQLTDARTAELEQAKSASMSYDAADQALNNIYQDLQSYLSPAEQDQLTDAQLAWLDYRDSHCAFEGGDQNTCLAQVTETRVNQLAEQLDTRSL